MAAVQIRPVYSTAARPLPARLYRCTALTCALLGGYKAGRSNWGRIMVCGLHGSLYMCGVLGNGILTPSIRAGGVALMLGIHL